MQEQRLDIGCKIFIQREQRIKLLTDRINLAKTVEGKAQFAEELAHEAKFLLNCGDYNEQRLDCINCQTVSSLRERMATLVLKTSIVLGQI